VQFAVIRELVGLREGGLKDLIGVHDRRRKYTIVAGYRVRNFVLVGPLDGGSALTVNSFGPNEKLSIVAWMFTDAAATNSSGRD
jgi:hypothetical protein